VCTHDPTTQPTPKVNGTGTKVVKYIQLVNFNRANQHSGSALQQHNNIFIHRNRNNHTTTPPSLFEQIQSTDEVPRNTHETNPQGYFTTIACSILKG
jgi:hypothetical protein